MLSINFGKAQDHCRTYCKGGVIDGQPLTGMNAWILQRVKKYLTAANINRSPQAGRPLLRLLKNTLTQQELEAILACRPENLLDKSREYAAYRNVRLSYRNPKGRIISSQVLPLLFHYKQFRKYRRTVYNGFTLSSELGVECCPYCNRHYTSTHSTFFVNNGNAGAEKRVFPEFDHFFCQTDHAVLGVSFYNLIPSCTICNTHYKNNRDSSSLFHPYTLHSDETFKFQGFPRDVESLYGAGTEISLGFKYECSAQMELSLRNSHVFFGIKDIYDKCHGDLIRDIIYKKLAFGRRYMDELCRTYGISFEDSYRIVFETHFEDENMNMRPFSKLKKDIFESRDL